MKYPKCATESSSINKYMLSPAVGLLGYFDLGDEVTLIAAKTL